MLAMPVGSDADVEVCPDRAVDAWTAYRWFTEGAAEVLPGVRSAEDLPAERPEVAEQLNAYRNHHIALMQYLVALADMRHHSHDPDDKEDARKYVDAVLETLVARRDAIRARGWTPPALPQDIRGDVERAEAARTHSVIPRAGQETER